jgi:hypothetical protein
MNRENGQSVLEALGFLMILGLLLGTLWQQFDLQAKQAQRQLEQSRAELWQLTSPADSQLSQDYAASRALAPIMQPLAQWTDLDLPLRNLRIIENTDTRVAVARLQDDWSPQQPQDLARRPAQLVPLHHLSQLGLHQVLEVFSWLPVSKDFAPSSLRLGWINDEATPLEIDCEKVSC